MEFCSNVAKAVAVLVSRTNLEVVARADPAHTETFFFFFFSTCSLD
jgi:hypothetical protein